MSRPLRLQSSPVRVLSRNFLPDGQSDIDFYHKFFDTLCWAEGRCCVLSNNQAFSGGAAAWMGWYAARLTLPGTWACRRQTGADPQQALL
jgi:hypothetical protein